MSDDSVCRVRPLFDADLEMILNWRNSPEVRSCMFHTDPIPLEQHRLWFAKASASADKTLLIFENEALPQGFVQFSRLTDPLIATWGFYTKPGSPKGSGRKLGQTAIRYAFTNLSLHKLCGHVLTSNMRSKRLHASLGFQLEGVLREHHFNGTNYEDVVYCGLLASEWKHID